MLAEHSWPQSVQKAEAQLAYELQAAKEQQKIRMEEIEIEVVQRKKQIAIEEKEIERTDKELIATVKRPAEAEAYKMQQLAEGHKWVVWHLGHCKKSFHLLCQSRWNQGMSFNIGKWLRVQDENCADCSGRRW